jgi:hypothetical protein
MLIVFNQTAQPCFSGIQCHEFYLLSNNTGVKLSVQRINGSSLSANHSFDLLGQLCLHILNFGLQ